MKLLPGTADLASAVVYGGFHALPLIIIGSLFGVMLAAALYGNTVDLFFRVMAQWSLMKMEFTFLVLGVILLSGALVGRAVCGWICPFGFLSDVLDRIALKRYRPPARLGYLKFLVLIFLFTAFLCQSGTVYGLMPYLSDHRPSRLQAGFAAGRLDGHDAGLPSPLRTAARRMRGSCEREVVLPLHLPSGCRLRP